MEQLIEAALERLNDETKMHVAKAIVTLEQSGFLQLLVQINNSEFSRIALSSEMSQVELHEAYKTARNLNLAVGGFQGIARALMKDTADV